MGSLRKSHKQEWTTKGPLFIEKDVKKKKPVTHPLTEQKGAEASHPGRDQRQAVSCENTNTRGRYIDFWFRVIPSVD